MKYGVSSMIEMNISEFIERVANVFKVIELVSEYPHVYYSLRNVVRLLELKEQYDLTYTMHAPFCSLNLASINPSMKTASVNEIVNSISYAKDLECHVIVVHPGVVSYPRGLKQFEAIAKRNQFDSFSKICEKAEEEKMLTCLENMPRQPPAFTDTWRGDGIVQIIDELASKWLKITMDVGHCNTTDIPIPEMIDKFGSRIKHVHIHDNDGFRESHSIVGQGSVNWNEAIRALRKIKYNGFLIDEHRTIEGLEKGRTFLEPIIKPV
jgi:sugar phosphate isomerase/epimerase